MGPNLSNNLSGGMVSSAHSVLYDDSLLIKEEGGNNTNRVRTVVVGVVDVLQTDGVAEAGEQSRCSL